MRTWKVLTDFEGDGHIDLACNRCGQDARMPTKGDPGCLVIAACGLGLITDPAGMEPREGWMPPVIQCRKCKTVWDSRGDMDVRKAV